MCILPAVAQIGCLELSITLAILGVLATRSAPTTLALLFTILQRIIVP